MARTNLIEALDNVTAALETCIAHYGSSMPTADRRDAIGSLKRPANSYWRAARSSRRPSTTRRTVTTRAWVQAINTALADREVETRLENLDDAFWERWIGPMLDAIEDEDPDNAEDGCPECQRSHGPHYRGPCEH